MYYKRFFQRAIMKALESEVITKSKYKRIAQSKQRKRTRGLLSMDSTDFQTHFQSKHLTLFYNFISTCVNEIMIFILIRRFMTVVY